MGLKSKIEEDFHLALKEKKDIEVSTLRLLKAAILNREKEKKFKEKKDCPLSEEEIIELIFSEIKKRKEAIVGFEKGKRVDLLEKEKKEIEILQKYLPQQLSDNEIKELAQTIIQQVEAEGIKDLGRVMKELMPKVKGKADGGVVNQIVKTLLSKRADI